MMTAGRLLFKQVGQYLRERGFKESKKRPHFDTISTLVLLGFLMALGLLFMTGGGIYWVYIYPPLAFFLKGKRQGMIWTVCLYILILLILLGYRSGFIPTFAYPWREIQQIFFSLTGLSFLILLYEIVRERHEFLLEKQSLEFVHKHVELSKEISERKRTEQALKESEARFHKVTEHTADALLVVDQQNVIRFMNPAAVPLFELQDKTLIGKKFGIPVIEGEPTELEIPHTDGTTSIVEIRSVAIDWENKPAYLESLRDITEHKRIQRALQESQTELEASYHREQERRRLSDTLREVARIVSSTLDQNTVVNIILNQLKNVVVYHRVTVMLLAEMGTLTVVAARDNLLSAATLTSFAIEKYPINASILQSKLPILVPNVADDERWHPSNTTQGIRSFIGSPLLVQEQPIGILAIGRRDETPYTPDDAHTVFAFATQVAIAVYNAQLHAKTQERNRRLALLHEISLAVNSTLDLKTLLTAACQKLVENFQVDHSGVLLFDNNLTYGEVVADFPPQQIIGERIPLERYILSERMIATVKPQAIDDAQHDPAMEQVWVVMRALNIQSILIVPLISQGQVIGSFSLDMTSERRQFNSSEIEIAQTIASQLAMAIKNARLLEAERTRLEHELETARQIQVSLFPPDVPKVMGLDISGFSFPARQIGGDFYNYFVFERQRVGIAVGDVSGKGMQSALMMALSFGLLSIEARSEVLPAALLGILNNELRPHTERNKKNTALAYLQLSPRHEDQWEFSTANAGLIAPLLRKKEGTLEWVDVGGLPLGMVPNLQYHDVHGLLSPGDMLLLMSDGLVEAMSATGEMYGFERLEACLSAVSSQNAQAVHDAILQDMRHFTGDTEVHDDFTLVIVLITSCHNS
ncbi:protein serine phosphatase with GAF(S) sensor(S) [Candidatus Vecturithrix granuli]|uniref:Protein serine phosphatase with GAF(S) sensor(S) n=1 Tax=Vecturithrix granuli TaxID=1499967 RepID=A0A081C754_VECG1|nr:protein serine phosphatase with GAF(S) sensor(S) [Candidatus Vecturithrix granuli]